MMWYSRWWESKSKIMNTTQKIDTYQWLFTFGYFLIILCDFDFVLFSLELSLCDASRNEWKWGWSPIWELTILKMLGRRTGYVFSLNLIIIVPRYKNLIMGELDTKCGSSVCVFPQYFFIVHGIHKYKKI